MPTPNLPLIAEFLKDRSASAREIASYLETTEESAHSSLRLMESRGQVVKGSGARLDAPWKLIDSETTPSVFKARETLSAMQEHIRRTL